MIQRERACQDEQLVGLGDSRAGGGAGMVKLKEMEKLRTCFVFLTGNKGWRECVGRNGRSG